MAKIAEAVYAAGTFKDVDVKPTKKIPARRPSTLAKTQGQASVGVTG